MKNILVISIMALGLAMFSPFAQAVIYDLEVEVAVEHASREFEAPAPGKLITDTTVFGFWAQPTMEVKEGLDVYLKLGMASIEAEASGEPTIEGDMGLGWGLGARFATPIGGIGEALEAGVGFEWLNLSSDFDAVAGVHDAGELEISGWSLSLFAREDLITWVPYLGLRYSDITLEGEEGGVARPDQDAVDNLGIFLGADIPMDLANINIEIGLLDETSFRVGASFAF